MRIITGIAKGISLTAPRGLAVRPTGDRVKESLFNMLGEKITGSLVLDMFAGTGNLGIEALSRGAAQAVFIDSGPRSVRCVRENLARTCLAERAIVLARDAWQALRQLAAEGRRFDIIFCDPPYNKGLAAKAPAMVGALDLLTPAGLLVVEHARHETMADETAKLQKVRDVKYGETVLSIYRSRNEEDQYAHGDLPGKF